VAADTEALVHYQQALESYERAFRLPVGAAAASGARTKDGEKHFSGEVSNLRLFEYLQRCVGHAGKPLPASLGGVRLAIVRELARQVAHRLFPALLLKPFRNSVTQAVEEEVRLNEFIGWIDAFQAMSALIASLTQNA